jgi:predicted DNA-binding transcriptional regulator AlpA
MAVVFLQDTQVAHRYGVCRVSIWRWLKADSTFPKPFKLSPGCVRWRLADLEAWEAARSEVSA